MLFKVSCNFQLLQIYVKSNLFDLKLYLYFFVLLVSFMQFKLYEIVFEMTEVPLGFVSDRMNEIHFFSFCFLLSARALFLPFRPINCGFIRAFVVSGSI